MKKFQIDQCANVKNFLQHIYVVHFEPLKDRRKQVEESLEPLRNIPTSWKIMNEETDLKAANSFSVTFSSTPKIFIALQELAVSLAHLEIYKEILREGYETCLIIEDDAILGQTFFENIETALRESKDYDFTFLSACCNLHVPRILPGLLQESSTSRSVCGYILRSNNLENIIKACEPFVNVIDHHLNHIRQEFGLRYAWSEPPLIGAGSESTYGSNLHEVRLSTMKQRKT